MTFAAVPPSTESLALMFGLFGAVIVISALLSGFVERSNFPQVAIFLGLGAALGPHCLGLLDIGLDSPMLQAVATMSLVLVLFTDALTLDLAEVRKHAGLASLILGPGTLVGAAVIAVAAVATLGLPWPMAALLAAPLASTDPVLLRGLLRRPDLPSAARQALRLESGLNDVVLLPIVLLAMTFAVPSEGSAAQGMAGLLIKMLVISPGIGGIIAGVGIWLLGFMRKRVGVRRDYESLYSIGIALAAFAAAEAFHGSGYLAAFAAGLTIAAIDVELCDCFREYGETTAEMLLLFTFVLLGTSLMWQGLGGLTGAVIAFAALALLARPAALLLSLAKSHVDRKSKRLIIWYGPRGLSTLLLVLVPVFAGIPGSEDLFHLSTFVVLLSIALHGGSMMLGNRGPKPRRMPVEVEPAITDSVVAPDLMTPEQILDLKAAGKEVWLVDVRSANAFLGSEEEIEEAVRIDPQHARREAVLEGIPKEAWVALFCT